LKLKITEHRAGFIILTTGVTLNYVFDGINKLGGLYFPFFSRTAILYRLLLELVCIFTILMFFNKKRLIWVEWFIYFVICFFISNIYLKYITKINVYIIEQFIYFNKYFFIFFIFFATYKTLENKNALHKIIKNFKKIFIINGCLAIIGLLFKIKLFSTIPIGTSRFGYDGLIFAQNEASIFYLLGLFVFYYEWMINRKPLKNLLFVIILCALTGMKAVLLGIVLLYLFHIFTRLTIKKIIYIFIGLISFSTIIVFSIPRLKILFGYYYYFFINKGFLYTMLGGRNTFIESRVIPYLAKSNIVAYLIGGQNISNVDDHLSLVEMDFIDLFLFFGILNGFFFLYLYKKYIIGYIQNKYFYFVVCLFVLLSFFSGHFFTSSVNPIFILIVFAYINNYINDRKAY
tara:strand:+ start:9293 stop:10498 length:1206 start_codon:yes stop_codon:yes gene_type:complete